jgi:hypothetical protein
MIMLSFTAGPGPFLVSFQIPAAIVVFLQGAPRCEGAEE